ncbi:MAG: tRNA (N(6)-L-threonylcarbamoyladenosine(37)-C(2))-methylthiotransferase MtaB [Flavobacteriaceae bacterium]|nr:tRNA (N(6)-L-threonylcarbamoyladenosine(37)-C(2))-methylthiotransferase MtaB [Flavobacteriaceae bacterium]
MKKRIAFTTLGCKLNFAETATISREFNTNKFKKVDFDKTADIYVINTCSVTENADKKLKKIVKDTQKINKEAFVVAIGCYAQLQPEQIISTTGVDLVLGTKEKFKLFNYLDDIKKNDVGKIFSCDIDQLESYQSSFSLDDRTRSFLKVQDGCDYKCTYCTIPKARGVSRSDNLNNIIDNVKKIASNGIKEIILTGVNIGDYGKNNKNSKSYENTFFDLIKALDEINEINRIRISSIEPNLLKNEIIEFISNSRRIVPHFHIPLQSGSDFILKKMKRRYLTSLYKSRIIKIKELIPNACIGADVIVGFPGESNDEFIKTYNFINHLPLSYLHIFSFSERPNTAAFSMKDVIPQNLRTKRSKMLRILSAKKRRSFYESQIGKNVNVLLESENKMGYITGFSENYIKVRTPWDPDLVNNLKKVKLKQIDPDGYLRF